MRSVEPVQRASDGARARRRSVRARIPRRRPRASRRGARRSGALFGRGADSGGTGVGLYLVRALMQRMGGRVEFHTAPGEGFRAELRFRGEQRGRRMSTGAHLLLVEDERNVAETLAERLQRCRLSRSRWRRVAAQARAGAGTAQAPHLALLDVGLPDGNGFELARAAARRARRSAAIIFLTAHGNPEDRMRGLELGADDYVTKPFHFRELLLRIQNCLKRAQDLARGAGRDARRGAHRPRARRLRALQRRRSTASSRR